MASTIHHNGEAMPHEQHAILSQTSPSQAAGSVASHVSSRNTFAMVTIENDDEAAAAEGDDNETVFNEDFVEQSQSFSVSCRRLLLSL